MSKRNIVLAAGLGLAVGYLAKQQVNHYQKVTPEKALNQAKEAFKKKGPISGSWIYMKPEEVEKNGLLYEAYRDRKSTRLNSSHVAISYAVFCLKKKKIKQCPDTPCN